MALKKYRVIVTEKKTDKEIENLQVESKSKAFLLNVYKSKYRFNVRPVIVNVEEIVKPIVTNQIDLEDMIKECENESSITN